MTRSFTELRARLAGVSFPSGPGVTGRHWPNKSLHANRRLPLRFEALQESLEMIFSAGHRLTAAVGELFR